MKKEIKKPLMRFFYGPEGSRTPVLITFLSCSTCLVSFYTVCRGRKPTFCIQADKIVLHTSLNSFLNVWQPTTFEPYGLQRRYPKGLTVLRQFAEHSGCCEFAIICV